MSAASLPVEEARTTLAPRGLHSAFAALHSAGDLDDDEFAAAKARTIGAG